MVDTKQEWPFEALSLLKKTIQCLHWFFIRLDVRVWFPIIFLVPGNNAMIQSMLVNSSPDGGSFFQYPHWSTLWFGHKSPCELTQDASPSHSIWITTFLYFIPNSDKSPTQYYTHCGDHNYLYFWVTGSLYDAYYSLTCGTNYKSHRWYICYRKRFICIHIILCV